MKLLATARRFAPRRAIGVAVAVASLSTPALAADVTASAKVSKADVAVGEPFTLTLTAQGPPGTEFVFPGDVQDEKIEIHPQPAARPKPGEEIYQAAVFTLTDAAVPALDVSYRLPDGTRGKVQTEAVPLKVRSLLARDAPNQQIADIRPPVTLSLGRAFFIALGLLGAVVLGLVIWLWRRRPVAAPAPVRPPVPPDVAAQTALDSLAASDLLDRGEYRPFYIHLTEIAKRYLEARMAAPVLEMTTAEMVAFLRSEWKGSELADLMRDVSGAADQIKFARGQGGRAVAEGHLDAVRRMVASVEMRRCPPVAQPPSPDARAR
jgi:hypothetical protein